MNVSTVIKELHPEADMAIQNSNDEGEKMNSGLCMSAGIKTPCDDDKNRFQKRHFPNKTTSDIFFCDLPLEGNVSSENIIDQNDSYCELAAVKVSAGIETRNTDEKQSEKRHFHLPVEDCTGDNGDRMTGENGDHNEDDQVDSSGIAESKENETADDNEKQTQRRHFYDKTSSNIFFSGLPSKDVILKDPANPSDFRKRKC